MPNLDIIYDVTIAVTWLKLSVLRGTGGKALATDHCEMKSNVFLVTRKVFLSLAHCMELPRLLPTTLNFLDKRRQFRKHTLSSSTDCNKKHSSKQTLAVTGRMKFVV